MPQPPPQSIYSTGIPSLDQLMGGGIPHRQSIVVTGDPGTGKTILGSQISFSFIRSGHNVVLATVASESNDKLLDELAGFEFFDRERIGNELFILSAYPWLKKGPKEARDLLLRSMRERDARLLFIDGLRSLRDLWQNEAKLRDFLYDINVGLAQRDAIGIFTTEYPIQKLMDYPEATTVDGIVALSTQNLGGRVVRRAQVVKLRGRKHLTGQHVMHITDDGIRVVPRLEERTVPAEVFTPTDDRASFGLPELDKILSGGLPKQSTTLLAGATGVGKTLLGLRFAAEGARAGEGAIFVTYSEPRERLVSRAARVGVTASPMIADGSLAVHYDSPLDVEADDLIEKILDRVQRTGFKRVVVDGLGELEDSIFDSARTRALLTALIVELRNRNVTALFIKEMAKIAGPEVDLSDTPISVTAENLILARYVEMAGKLHRVISVLKMRESGYDPYLREFEVGERGVRVLEPFQSAEGVLTGIARLVNVPRGEK